MKANYEEKVNEMKTIIGQGNIDNNYIAGCENNQYIKKGNIVTYKFTMQVKTNFESTTSFVTGLPKPLLNTRFTGVLANATNQGQALRFELRTDGSIHNAYSPTTPQKDNHIEGYICYISED